MTTPTVLAIIPARSGSKRLKHKNTLMLRGKPLVQWSIDAALASSVVTETVLSSDDAFIEDLCSKQGLPFIKRPAQLATDTATSMDVVIHVLDHYKAKGRHFDYVLLLQPTSPLRTARHIDEAFSLLSTKGCDGVLSVCECADHPYWSKALDDDLNMKNFLPSDYQSTRKQDLPKYYKLNGAIYLHRYDAIMNEKTFFLSDNIYAYLMSAEASVDVDTELDFRFAECLLEHNANNL